ncbi:flagellar brake protein [Bdellovibrio reynosensis]|uniref:PilZ domain-containing protein n=1 Tax=Bdellovibrio reynosensis TaxID=2835041 RepID=A0ABY4CAF3_9BACT|nr:PilZ domain-containing protein [Bdellovibrio reynosensis]UOF01454.1 PilZ domain-containing protein [Bdellovibrio reynosensis]
MNSDNGQTIFKKISISEKKMIFREVAHDKVQVVVKGKDRIFHLIAVQSEKDEALMCHHTADSKDIKENQEVLVNFAFKTERYFIQTELYFEAGWAVLKIDKELFQLQRRANFRVDIPAKYDAIFNFTEHQGKKYFFDCKVKDVSAGGFKMELGGDPVLKIGDKVKGHLRIGNRRPLEFEVEVRFSSMKEAEDKKQQIAGVQFLNVEKITESKLMTVITDLQREIFLKYPKKN